MVLIYTYSGTCASALQRTNIENLKQIFPEKELLGHNPNFHIRVSVSDIYIPTIDLPMLLQEICEQSLKYINSSQTHECGNWDRVRAIPRKEIFINGIFVAVCKVFL
jgi:hypothetical protein